MSMKAVFSYTNPDATTDMNAHFRILFNKGIVSGGTISPIGGTFQVSVAPFAAVSADGMVIEQDEATTLTIPSATKGIKYHIVLVAQYNAPSAPTLQLQVISEATYTSSTNTYYIIMGSVTLTATSTSVTEANISYDAKNSTAKIGHLNVKGSLSKNDTPPLTQNSAGDLYVVYDNEPPYFVVWSGSAWVTFTDYSQLELDYTTHVTDHGDFTGTTATTDARHVTKAMKAALAGTVGLPGADNKFVTESDSNKTLGSGERDGLTNAVGGTLSATNPVVSRNMSVLEERVVAYTAQTGGQAEASVASTINSTPVYVFVGTRGLETNMLNEPVSTARQFFRVEDQFGKGLVLNGQPVYVTDVALNGVSFSTDSATTVSDEGFWNGTGALSVKFNRSITAGVVFYLRYNIRGVLTALSPSNRATGGSGRYAVPPTGYQNRIESYIESYVINANTVASDTITVREAGYFAAGSESAPSITFSDDKLTGLFYPGNTTEGASSNYSGLGVAINGQTLLVMGRAASNIDIASHHILEADVDEDGKPYHKWSVHTGGASERAATFMFGTSNYLNDFDPYFGIRFGTYAENFGKLTTPYVSVQKDMAIEGNASNKLSVNAGTAASPSLVFNRTKSGFFYFDQVGDAVHSMYKGVGVSIDGVPLVYLGQNETTSASLSGSGSILMVERDGTTDLRVGLWSPGNGPGALRIGHANYVTDWVDDIVLYGNQLEVHTDLSVLGAITATGKVSAPGVEVSDTGFVKSGEFIALSNGVPASPAFKFAGSYSNYGLMLNTPANYDNLVFGTLMSLVVKGQQHLALGRDTWSIGSSSSMSNPLMVNSYADGASEFGYHVSIPWAASSVDANHRLSFGASYYNNDFKESLSLLTTDQGNASWHLRDDFHVEPGAEFVFNVADSTVEGDPIRMGIRDYSNLGAHAVTIDGILGVQDKFFVTAGSTNTVPELVLGTGSLSATNFTSANSTHIKDWARAQSNGVSMLDLSGAWGGNVAIALQNLIKMLGYNASQPNDNILHSLFPYHQ